MFKVTLKGLRAHTRRLVSTLLAVFSGVAFLAGTLMLSDTIGKTFDDLFADVYQGTDAVVRSSNVVEGGFGNDDVRGRIDASLIDRLRDVDGVAEAEGTVRSYAQIVGADGEALGDPSQGPPTFGSDWPEFADLNPFHLVEGHAPRTDDEVVIDRKSAKDGDIAVGDRIGVLTKDRPFEVTVAGIAKFGDADSPGGASFVMSPSPAEINQILGLVYAMLAFAVLIALMGIANTLSLSIHERTRELGLLRAVGMSRAQLRSSVRWESVIIAVFGTLGGLGIAVFFGWVAVTAADEEALTFTFPAFSLLFIVILAALAGVLAGLRPAFRAAKLDILQAIATE